MNNQDAINKEIQTIEEIALHYFDDVWVRHVPNEGASTIAVDSNYIITLYKENITVTCNESPEDYEDIKDVYVRLNIQYGRFVNSMDIAKAHYTYKQALRGYTHSHSPIRKVLGAFDRFCLGTTTIGSFIHNFPIEEAQYHFIFKTVLDLLSVESLTGGPYLRVKYLRYAEQCNYNDYYDFSSATGQLYYENNPIIANRTKVIDDIIKNVIKRLPVNISKHDSGIRIADRPLDLYLEACILYFEEARKVMKLSDIPKFFGIVDEQTYREIKYNCNGSAFREGSIHSFNTTPIQFKDKQIPITIEEPEEKITNEEMLLMPVNYFVVIYKTILSYLNKKSYDQKFQRFRTRGLPVCCKHKGKLDK